MTVRLTETAHVARAGEEYRAGTRGGTRAREAVNERLPDEVRRAAVAAHWRRRVRLDDDVRELL